MRDLPHPFWAKYGETEKGHITAVRNDLPGIAAHTGAGGPKRARGSVTSTGFDLRTRIPLARSARFLGRAPTGKTVLRQFKREPSQAGAAKLLDLDLFFFYFAPPPEIYTLSLHDAFLDG